MLLSPCALSPSPSPGYLHEAVLYIYKFSLSLLSNMKLSMNKNSFSSLDKICLDYNEEMNEISCVITLHKL